MPEKLFLNARIVNEGIISYGYLTVDGEFISSVGRGTPDSEILSNVSEIIDLKGKYILPGCIDDQVHFREPGLTHKADIASESRAALAGGVTSFMDMPNVKPPTVTLEAWEDKMRRGKESSTVNYSFWLGATNDNTNELPAADFSKIPGIKVFLGASTGNMLVDSEKALDSIFSSSQIVAVHSEDENIIRGNSEIFKKKYFPGEVPMNCHPLIRSREACLSSTQKAIKRAFKHGTRLLLLHLSTADEAKLLEPGKLTDKKINSEVCVHHLWFTDEDYSRLGTRIKWNPAVKTATDRDELRKAVADGRIDIVATDHAPHLLEEKAGDALHAASGGPLVQHSLLMMLELAKEGYWGIEKVVEMMAHNPAELFGVEKRGYLRPGYYADIVILNPSVSTAVCKSNLLTKCGWSPLEGTVFSNTIESVFVNGSLAYENKVGKHIFHPHSVHSLEFSHR